MQCVLFQAEDSNPSILTEMMVDAEGSCDMTRVKDGERQRVAQRPVLVRVSSQDLLGFVLFRREYRHHRQSARQQPLTGNRPPELSDQQGVYFGLEVPRRWRVHSP
jgi:hypothetical protein